MSAEPAQTEFDISVFNTEVTEQAVDDVILTIVRSIRALRDQINDDTLDSMLRAGAGSYVLRGDFTEDQLDPEPLTKNRIIEPILETLGYDDYGYEAGSFARERGEQADYSVPLRDIDRVDSTRLLIEAEPINKPLRDRGHGLDQVKSWLSQREFESDFGFATDGLRWIFVRYDPDAYSHNVIEEVDLQSVFIEVFELETTTQDNPTDVLSEDYRSEIRDLIRSFSYDNFISIITDAREVIREREEAITDEFYDDYIEIVFGVADEVEDERKTRSLVGEGIVAPENADGEDVRLFAVELMNRLIFIKFLEDKNIVRRDLLGVIRETYDDGIYPQSLYKSFIDPLFYDVLNEKPENREPQIKQIDLYSDIPYLNGGLFRPEFNGESELNERQFNVRDSVLISIIDLLERYHFSADGGPSDIDPSVLGNVFEKTINYLTTDPGNQNKELGAYYTPSEITRFCAEETVRPALHEKFETILIEEREWPEAEVSQYDTLYELIEGLPPSGDLITSLLAEMDDFSALDPAMGSGHFLTSVLEEIVNIRHALYRQLEGQQTPSRHRLKKTTVLNNIYGVDIVGPAVEIGKLRLWLSIIAEVAPDAIDKLSEDELALPNIAFNVREGNSLIGFIGFPDKTKDGNSTLERFEEDSVRSRYQEIIDEINQYQTAITNEQAEQHRRNAYKLLEKAREELVDEIRDEFINAGITDVTIQDIEEYDPFHWVLEFAEVFSSGGFDVIVGNPPWDVLTPNREEFFARYDPQFRTRSQSDKDRIAEELLQDSDKSEAFEVYKQNMQRRADYFNDSESYELQTPRIAGRIVPNNQNELSALFLERVYSLSSEGGFVAQVLPGTIFSGSNSKDVRLHLLDHTNVQALIAFENHGIFDGLHNQYKFGVIVFKNSGNTDVLRGTFQQRDPSILNNYLSHTIEIPRRVLAEFSPESGVFPFVTRQEEVDALVEILRHPSIGEEIQGKWKIDPYSEVHRSKDSDYLYEDEQAGDYPIYEGKNIYQFSHDPQFFDIADISLWGLSEDAGVERSAKAMVRSKGERRLKKSIYETFGGSETSKSQVQFVDDLLQRERGEPLSSEDVLLDSTQYRIGIREVTNSTNERTLIAAVIPQGALCVHTLHAVRPYKLDPKKEDLHKLPLHDSYERIFSDKELFSALALLNSIPFDFLMRTKVESHIVMYKLRESQMPRLSEGDEWFGELWEPAAKLNCYGEQFQELRDRLGIQEVTDPEERASLQACMDAAAFHAYGLGRNHTKFILDEFYKVENPRVMTEEYFDLVLEKYDRLASQE